MSTAPNITKGPVMDYIRFLRWLTSLGDKLPAALLILDRMAESGTRIGEALASIIADAKEILALFVKAESLAQAQADIEESITAEVNSGRTFAASAPLVVTAADEAVENDVLFMARTVGGPFNKWDGSRIRNLWTWLNEHPAIISIIGLLI